MVLPQVVDVGLVCWLTILDLTSQTDVESAEVPVAAVLICTSHLTFRCLEVSAHLLPLKSSRGPRMTSHKFLRDRSRPVYVVAPILVMAQLYLFGDLGSLDSL